jgi:hypothetical protein
MSQGSYPEPHPDPWVDLLHRYVTRVVEALQAGGVYVERSLLDPMNPRDATIVCSPAGRDSLARPSGLVWDEVTGWRIGPLLEAQQGIRTRLAEVKYIGGGVLPKAPEVAYHAMNGAAAPRREYRSVADVRDGLDDSLREVL